MVCAPIVLFAFNRVNALEMTLSALAKNRGAEQSDLYIYVDGPRNDIERPKVEEVYSLACQAKGFLSVSVKMAEVNKGLGPSIISGVSEVIGKYGRVIVLEDDLVVTPDFLQWMNDGLDKYESASEVFSVCGYTNKVKIPGGYGYDGYFAPRSSSWGWASWKDRWESVNWAPSRESIIEDARRFNRWGGSDCFKMLLDWSEGRNKSWAIRFCYSQFLQGKVSLFPVLSLVDPTLGFSGDGTNCKRYSRFKWEIFKGKGGEFRLPGEISVVPALRRSALRYHSLTLRAWSWLMYRIYR